MKKVSFKWLAPLASIAVLMLMVGWMAGLFTDKITPGTTPILKVDSSQAIAVVKLDQPSFEPAPASIQAKQASVISSRILARVDKVHVRAGEIVKQGQLLIELEQDDLKARVMQAKAQVRSVKARLKEAQQALIRAQELNAKGLLANADLEKLQANYDALAASLSTINQSVLESESALGFAQIRSPMNGIIVDRFAEPGSIAQPGKQLLSLYNPESVRVEANIREKLALSLTLGQKLRVLIPATEQWLDAEIEERVPAGNPGSRSFLIKSRLYQTQGLLPGMYARLMVPSGTESVLLIPEGRVARVGQLDVVWVANHDHIERRFIRAGKKHENGLLEVVSGLKEGDMLLPIPIDN